MEIWTMLKRAWAGLSSVLAAKSLWPGSTPPPIASNVDSSPVAVKGIIVETFTEYDLLIAELFADTLVKLEKRLEFEAWADSR